METLASISSSFLRPEALHIHRNPKTRLFPLNLRKTRELAVMAAKLPLGVEMPKVEPKLLEPFLGFTATAEIWNSRACMIGIVGTFIVELIFHRGFFK